MKKQISTIGIEIPGQGENEIDFSSHFSLMDADIVVISPDSIRPYGDWVSFSAGGGCYNVEPSKRFQEKSSHLQKELRDLLNSGKTAFIFLSRKEEFQLAQSVSSPRKGQHTYNTLTIDNYKFLPIDIGSITNASGKHLKFTGENIFTTFDKTFSNHLEYQLYIENTKGAQVIYSGKDTTKVLGSVFKIGKGHMVVLPILKLSQAGFTEIKVDKLGKEEEFWSKKGLAFGNSLISCLVEIDKKLKESSDKTPPPEWINEKAFQLKKEIEINGAIINNTKAISKLQKENEKLKEELANETTLKDLLFENGKTLETAVTKALHLLGYKAENYDDGQLEMDQIIVSPENYRYIGECEGKDNKDIDVSKFRQLQDALNADFARDEVAEKAFGILFGNPERFINPESRKLDFTAKCKSGAEREKIALVKTSDLFIVAKYLSENNNETYKKQCRLAIHSQLGKVVVFPKLPK